MCSLSKNMKDYSNCAACNMGTYVKWALRRREVRKIQQLFRDHTKGNGDGKCGGSWQKIPALIKEFSKGTEVVIFESKKGIYFQKKKGWTMTFVEEME